MSSSYSIQSNRNEMNRKRKNNDDNFDDSNGNDDDEEDYRPPPPHPIIIDDDDIINDDDDDDEDSRVILHFDLDAFYVACERELNPQLQSKPVAVSQYNPYGNLEEKSSHDIHGRWVVQGEETESQQHGNKSGGGGDTNGSLIAVSYEARAAGVKRNQRGKEACSLCKTLNIVQVPVKHGKADLKMYRTASKRVMEALQNAVLNVAASTTKIQSQEAKQQQKASSSSSSTGGSKKSMLFEIASIDEAYMDITVLANQLVEHVIQDGSSSFSSSSSTLWQSIVDAAGSCTTIGGIEVLSKAARATNALDKDEIRRGSHVQVLDSNNNTNNNGNGIKTKVDSGSQAWWERHQSKFSSSQIRLACGAYLAAKAREAVQSSFEGGVYTLSCGISTNKTLAKLASGLKKPNRQTLIYRDQHVLQKLFHPLPLGRIRGLGGKFGIAIANHLNIETLGQLAEFSLSELQKAMKGMGGDSNNNKTAQFLYDISKGLCRDEVTPRNKPKSIECSKTFRGHLAINVDDKTKLQKWVGELCSELQERLQQDHDDHNRIASTMKVSVGFQLRGEKRSSYVSKQCRAPRALERYRTVAIQMIQQLIDIKNHHDSLSKNLQITGLGVGGMQFVTVAEGSSSILAAIQKQQQHHATSSLSSSPPSLAAQSPSKKPTINSIVLLGTKQRPSMMEQWLQDSSSSKIDVNDTIRKDVTTTTKWNTTTTTEPSSKRAKTGKSTVSASSTIKGASSSRIKSYLSSEIGNILPTSSSHRSTLRPAVSVPQTMDEIDADVFEALPKDVQRAVLGDIQYQQQQRNRGGGNRNHQGKRGGIQSFFQAQTRNKNGK